jgi:primosomal protein N' (replication factor Y)
LQCGSAKLRQGGAGSSRTASELGKSFPGVKIIEATFAKRILELPAGKCLVVATPGAEPVIEGGYQSVILLDGQKLLSRDTLRASEQAVNSWSNALSLMSAGGRAVGVGLASPLGQKFALWDHAGIARDELRHRRELNFPPHFRLASVTGPRTLIDEVISGLASTVTGDKPGTIEVLGPLAVEKERVGNGKVPNLSEPLFRYLIRFDYSLGEVLAAELRARSLKVNAGNKSFNQNTGRASRAVRVKMDDSEVI